MSVFVYAGVWICGEQVVVRPSRPCSCGMAVLTFVFLFKAAVSLSLLGFRSTGPFVIMIKEMVQYGLARVWKDIHSDQLGSDPPYNDRLGRIPGTLTTSP